MEDNKRFDFLSKRIDNLDKEYSSTLSELLTDVHYIKCKVNKTEQLDYEQKQNDIEIQKADKLNQSFVIKFVCILGACTISAFCILGFVKYLFF